MRSELRLWIVVRHVVTQACSLFTIQWEIILATEDTEITEEKICQNSEAEMILKAHESRGPGV
jgi:hypothetical protein